MKLTLQHGTAELSGQVEPRAAGSLSLSEPRELLVTRGIRAGFRPDRTIDPETLRWWGPGAGSPIEDLAEKMPEIEVVAEHEEVVVWGGCVIGHFGHFLIETASRFWPLLPGGECEGADVVLTTPSGPRFTREWLDGFGAPIFELPAEGAVRFLNVRVPEQAWRIDAYVTPEVREIHLKARDGLELPDTPASDVLWLSRTGIELDRRVRDEALLEWLLGERVSVIRPETLTLAGQVAALESTKAVTGSIGSAFHTQLMVRDVPDCVYLTPARVASPFAAQDWLLEQPSSFVQTMAIEQMQPRYEKRREGHRLLVPESLRALGATMLEGLLDDSRLARFAHPELPAARIEDGDRPDPDLDRFVLRALLDSDSIDARMSLAGAFESAGLNQCALEQFFLVADWTDAYAYGPLRAARLLAASGDADEAARMAARVLAIDPDSKEAGVYANS